jgi:hypothetical protein
MVGTANGTYRCAATPVASIIGGGATDTGVSSAHLVDRIGGKAAAGHFIEHLLKPFGRLGRAHSRG